MFRGWFRLVYRYTYTLREDWELINKKDEWDYNIQII